MLLKDEVGVRDKKIHYARGSLKITIFTKRVSQKNIQGVDLPKKREIGQFADLRGAWQKRGGGVFEGT